MSIRPVKSTDFFKSHIALYNQLSKFDVDKITIDDYIKFIDKLNESKNIFVIEENEKIIGTITILIEQKIIHNNGIVAHIEDVVIDENYRGKGFGAKLVEYAIDYVKNRGCYKVILNCSDDNMKFYEKNGFKRKDNGMTIYFN